MVEKLQYRVRRLVDRQREAGANRIDGVATRDGEG
jgi:hypothetical protein